MASPAQKKQKTVEQKMRNAVITRVVFDREVGPKSESRKHLRLDFKDGGTVLITGQFAVLYNDPQT